MFLSRIRIILSCLHSENSASNEERSVCSKETAFAKRKNFRTKGLVSEGPTPGVNVADNARSREASLRFFVDGSSSVNRHDPDVASETTNLSVSFLL